MLTNEFYKTYKVFNSEVLNAFPFFDNSVEDAEILNYLFLDRYSNTCTTLETQEQADEAVRMVLNVHYHRFQSIYEAIDAQLNPEGLSGRKIITDREDTTNSTGNTTINTTVNAEANDGIESTNKGYDKTYDSNELEEITKQTGNTTSNSNSTTTSNGSTNTEAETKNTGKDTVTETSYNDLVDNYKRIIELKTVSLYVLIVDAVADVTNTLLYIYE